LSEQLQMARAPAEARFAPDDVSLVVEHINYPIDWII